MASCLTIVADSVPVIPQDEGYGRPVGPGACHRTLSGLYSLTTFSWIAPLLTRGWANAIGVRSAVPFVPDVDRPAALGAQFESCYSACKARPCFTHHLVNQDSILLSYNLHVSVHYITHSVSSPHHCEPRQAVQCIMPSVLGP